MGDNGCITKIEFHPQILAEGFNKESGGRWKRPPFSSLHLKFVQSGLRAGAVISGRLHVAEH